MQLNHWASRLPCAIPVLAVAILAFGCLALNRSNELSDAHGRFLHRQLGWCIVFGATLLLTTLPCYRAVGRWSYLFLAVAMLMLLAVYWFPPTNGAQRWVRWGFIGFQPSEFAKLAFVLGLARYLMWRENYRLLVGLLIPLLLTLLPALLILKEPDLGTSLLLFPVLFAMLFAAGARKRHLAITCVAGIALMPVLWSQMSREQQSRVTALFAQAHDRVRSSDDGYHLHQAKQLFALGGFWGSALTGEVTEDRSVYFVPEPHTDSILSIAGERYGLWGVGLLLSLFVLLVGHILAIAEATREPFGRLVAIGVATLLGVQVLINCGMIVGLLPITGLTLPLVSYGGSSVLANALGLGLVLNIGLRPGYDVSKDPFAFADTHDADL